MKKLILILAIFITSGIIRAQSNYGVMGGINLSTSSVKGAELQPGGFIGGLLDLRIKNNLYFQPRIMLSYQENLREMNNPFSSSKEKIGDEYCSQWAITIPTLLSFKKELTNDALLGINIGPYLQYAVFGRSKRAVTYYKLIEEKVYPETHIDDLRWWHLDLKDKITYGVQIGMQVSYKNFFGAIDYKHSLRRSYFNMEGYENTILIGVGYKF